MFTCMCSALCTPPNTDVEPDFVVGGADPGLIYNYVIKVMSCV